MRLLLILSVSACASGCVSGSRVVLVDPSQTIIRIGPDVRGRVYTKDDDGAWELSRNKVHIPEGWYAGQITP